VFVVNLKARSYTRYTHRHTCIHMHLHTHNTQTHIQTHMYSCTRICACTHTHASCYVCTLGWVPPEAAEAMAAEAEGRASWSCKRCVCECVCVCVSACVCACLRRLRISSTCGYLMHNTCTIQKAQYLTIHRLLCAFLNAFLKQHCLWFSVYH
jgi:hypothetical protein